MLTLAEWEAIRLTLLVATAAVAGSMPVGIASAWLLARRTFPGKFLLETAINLPLVVPPVVTGYLLLILLGRNGVVGEFLERVFGWRFIFDWKGAALASAIVGFPLLVRPIRMAFAAVDEKLIHASRTLGAGRWDAFWSISLPLARSGILSGGILAFARSMGEFGATIMIAGNIPGQTRTVPLLIYTQLDAPDGVREAFRLVVASIVISAVALLLSEILERRVRRRLGKWSDPT